MCHGRQMWSEEGSSGEPYWYCGTCGRIVDMPPLIEDEQR